MDILDRSDGSYQQERLFLLSRIDQLEKDVDEAHKRYRKLESAAGDFDRRLISLKIRVGYIAAGMGVAVAAAIEGVSKLLFH